MAHKITPRDRRHAHPHTIGRSGRVYVARQISRGRVIPGYRATDPLTLPIWERDSVWARYREQQGGLASDEREQLARRWQEAQTTPWAQTERGRTGSVESRRAMLDELG